MSEKPPKLEPSIPNEWASFFSEDPYTVLGIPNGADKAAIKKVRNTLLKKFHEDINPHELAKDISQRINRAFEALVIKPDLINANREYTPEPIAKTTEFIAVAAERKIFVHSNPYNTLDFSEPRFTTLFDANDRVVEGPAQERSFIVYNYKGRDLKPGAFITFHDFLKHIPAGSEMNLDELAALIRSEVKERKLFTKEHHNCVLVRANENTRYFVEVSKFDYITAPIELDVPEEEYDEKYNRLLGEGGYVLHWTTCEYPDFYNFGRGKELNIITLGIPEEGGEKDETNVLTEEN